MSDRDRLLVVVYDVSELSLTEISNLDVAAVVQAEAERGDYQHPAVRVRSYVVDDPIKVEAIRRDTERGTRQ